MTPTTTTIMKTFALKRAWTDAFVVYPETDDGALAELAPSLPPAFSKLAGDQLLAAVCEWLRARGQPDAISTALEGIAARLGTVAKTTKDAPRARSPPPPTAAPVAPSSPEPASRAAPAVEPTTEHVAPPPPAPRHAPTARRARRARATGVAAPARGDDDDEDDDDALIAELTGARAFWAATPLRPRVASDPARDEYEVRVLLPSAAAADALELTADAENGVVGVRGVVVPRAEERAELARAVRHYLARRPRASGGGDARRREIGELLRQLARGHFGRVDESLRLPSDARPRDIVRLDDEPDPRDGTVAIVLRVPRAAPRRRSPPAFARPRAAPPRAWRDEPMGWPGLAAGGPAFGMYY